MRELNPARRDEQPQGWPVSQVIVLFPLIYPYHLGYGILRQYLDQHVHKISHHMSFHYLAASMPGHFMKHRSKTLPYLPVQYLLAPFGYKHHMILAIPFRMI